MYSKIIIIRTQETFLTISDKDKDEDKDEGEDVSLDYSRTTSSKFST